MEELIKKHRSFWTNREILLRMALCLILILLSVLVSYSARNYTNIHADGYVIPDVLLDSLPVFNVGLLFFQGAFLFVFIVMLVLIYEPRYIPFTLDTSALFFMIRSFFTSLTHLSAPSMQYYHYIEQDHNAKEVLFTLSSGNDLFFSGHAGFPFLLALIFWYVKPLRIFFLLCSAAGSLVVLLGHLHYSIDVFSAFFITYGVFEISKFLFKKEYVLLRGV